MDQNLLSTIYFNYKYSLLFYMLAYVIKVWMKIFFILIYSLIHILRYVMLRNNTSFEVKYCLSWIFTQTLLYR